MSFQAITTHDELRKRFDIEAEQGDLQCQVFSSGPLNADTALVGEGPGQAEMRHSSKRPFVGGAGSIMWRLGKPYGLTRDNVYTTNVVKRQISLSSQGDKRHEVKRPEFALWTALLHWELRQLPNLKYVLVMGKMALEALIGEDKITNHRGSVYTINFYGRELKVVCTFNTAFVTKGREPRFEPFVQMDMEKLHRVRTGKWIEHEIRPHINPTIEQFKDFMRYLIDANKPIAIDVEEMGGELACIGLANDPHEGMCMNLRDMTMNRFTEKEEIDLMQFFQESINLIQKTEGCLLVAQNALFDSYFLWLRSRLKVVFDYDTLLAHHTLYPMLPHNLGFLVAQYTNHPFYKDDFKRWQEGGDVNSFWRYNVKDAALTIAVMQRIEREWEDGLDDFFFEHVMRLQPHLVEATVHGVAVDQELKEHLAEEIENDVEKVREEFQRIVCELTGDQHYIVNPRSHVQMRELYFNRLGLIGKGHSTDADNRKKMLAHPKTGPLSKELLTSVEKFKEEDGFLSRYVKSRESDDGRMRTEYKQFGTQSAPGRLSSAGLLDGTGTNLQNQSHRAYEMFECDSGCVFIYFDAAQAEARIVAYRADIPKWKADFERARLDKSFDCHRKLASEMWKIPYDDIPTNDKDENLKPTKRFIGKRCRHGLNYRMFFYTLAAQTGLSFHDAVLAYRLYHATTPELKMWWDVEEWTAKKTKKLFNAFGRRWYAMQRIDDTVLQSVVAFYPQSTLGDKICKVWYQAQEDDCWPKHQARVALNVHDALIGIATKKVAKTALKILQEYMEEPIMIRDARDTKTEPLIIPADLKISVPGEDGVHRWSTLQGITL